MKLNENQKITLTIGQLKRLVKEARRSSSKDFEIEDGVLKKYHGKGGDVVIPDGITSIGYCAFRNCRSLTLVTIPNSVMSIGEGAFYGCDGLTSVTIGNGVTSIGKSAFFCCSGLTSVIIPGSVTSIGDCAFDGCRGLVSVTIPDSVTSIGECAFQGCFGLTSVTIPDSVKEIKSYAFCNCERITSMTIPNGAKLGEKAFEIDVLARCKHGDVICKGDSIIPYRTGVERYKSIEWKSPSVHSGNYMFYIASDGDFKMKCHYPRLPERYPLSGHSDHGVMICQKVDITAAEKFVKKLFRKVESLSNVTWSELVGIVDKQVAKFKDSCAKAGGNTEEHPWWYGTSDHMRD